MHERIEDDAAAAAALGDHHHYAEGEVSMINVLAQDVSTKLEFEVLRERLDGLEGAVSDWACGQYKRVLEYLSRYGIR